MIDGNVNEFVDGLYRGSEWWFLYKGKKYFIQGWWKDGLATLVLDCSIEDQPAEYVWENTVPDMEDNVKKFLDAPIWDDGKNFWQVEKDMTWID